MNHAVNQARIIAVILLTLALRLAGRCFYYRHVAAAIAYYFTVEKGEEMPDWADLKNGLHWAKANTVADIVSRLTGRSRGEVLFSQLRED